MRKALPFLLALPMIAVAIWAKVTSGADPAPESVQAPNRPEIRSWRTGIELLSPKPQQPPQASEDLDPHTHLDFLPDSEPPSRGLTRLTGSVYDYEARPLEGATVFSKECPGRGYTDARGIYEIYVFLSEPTECDLQVMTQHGMLSAVSETKWVTVNPEEGRWVDLDVDDSPQGGIGVGFMIQGDGAVVTWVHPFGPAMAAGLEQGDVIQQVNDLDLIDVFDPTLFTQETVGPVGSEVTLFLEGEEDGLVLVRAAIREEQTGPGGNLSPDPPDEATLDTGLDPSWDALPEEAPFEGRDWGLDTGWQDTGWVDDQIWADDFY